MMKRLSILFVLLLLCPVMSSAGDAVTCTEVAQGVRDSCLIALANQCQGFCQAVAEGECVRYTEEFCLPLGGNPFCMQTIFQQCMNIIAPQVIYECTLQYLEGMAYTCDGVYEEAYDSCMSNP